MANFNNSAKIFDIQARQGVVVRNRINTMSTTGKASLKSFELKANGNIANMALELGMYSKTIGQLLQAKVNHVLILVSDNTATRFYQAQAAIKAGSSKEEAVQKVIDTISTWQSDTTGIAESLPEAIEAYFAVADAKLDITVQPRHTAYEWVLDGQACRAAGITDGMELTFENSVDTTYGIRCYDMSYLNGVHTVHVVGNHYVVERDGLSGINARRLVGWAETPEQKARFVEAGLPENVGVTSYSIMQEKLPHVAAVGELEEDGADI